MKRALKEISDMATSLEATGVDRLQAGATLEAIANSIEKFAVTPERLREILEESQQALYERIKKENDQQFELVNQRFEVVNQRFEVVNQRFDGVNQRFDGVNQRFESVSQKFDGVNQRLDDLTKNTNERFNDVNRRIDDMRAEQRADSSRLFNLMLAMALGMASVAGSWLFSQFL